MSAMRSAANLISNAQRSIPESFFRKLPRNTEKALYVGKYKDYLKDLKVIDRHDAPSYINFTHKYFKSFPKGLMKNLIDESLKYLKEKDVANYTPIYNTVIRNYISNDIGFDVKEILQEMNNNKVLFNKGTYQLLIEIYCDRNDMNAVENILDLLKSKNMEVDNRLKKFIIAGYIGNKQPEKAKEYMEENKMDANDTETLLGEVKGYATICDINQIISVLTKLKNKNDDLPPSLNFYLYGKLLKSNASDSSLNQIFQLIINSKMDNNISALIIYLNRMGYFNHTMKLVEKNMKHLIDRSTANDILFSFNMPDCPLHTYKHVLELLLDYADVTIHRNLFTYMNSGDAYKFAQKVINPSNGKVVMTSLLSKAIENRSVTEIENTLTLAINNLSFVNFNVNMYFSFVPAMLESALVNDSVDIITLLPKHKSLILPVLCMYNLCRGNIDQYNNLIPLMSGGRKLSFSINTRQIGSELCRNISLSELENFVIQCKKVFSNAVTNKLLASFIAEKLVTALEENGVITDFKEIQVLVQKYGIIFREEEINYLRNRHPGLSEVLKTLPINQQKTEMEHDNKVVDTEGMGQNHN